MFQWLKSKLGFGSCCNKDEDLYLELLEESNKTIQILVVYLGALILNKHGNKVVIDSKFINMMANNENLVLDEQLMSDNSVEIEVKRLEESDDNKE